MMTFLDASSKVVLNMVDFVVLGAQCLQGVMGVAHARFPQCEIEDHLYAVE